MTNENLFYGNPLLYQKEIMNSQLLGVLLNKIKNENPQIWNAWVSSFPPPPTSEIVEEDLLKMVSEIEKQTSDDASFIHAAETNKEKLFIDLMKKKGIDISEEELVKITYYLDPITMGLKYHFNYPRPYQVAYFRNIPLYPSQSTNANSPAYPSGHAIDSLCIGTILSKRFPEHREAIMNLAYRISKSRHISGIHFSFDKSFGESIGIYIGENYSEFLTEMSRG
jgi:hypothetical protein